MKMKLEKKVLKVEGKDDHFFSEKLANLLKKESQKEVYGDKIEEEIKKMNIKDDFEKILFSKIKKVSHYKKSKESERKKKVKNKSKYKYFHIVSDSNLHKKLFSSWIFLLTGIVPDMPRNSDFPESQREKMEGERNKNNSKDRKDKDFFVELITEVSASYRFPLGSVKNLSTSNMISALSQAVRMMSEGWILVADNLESQAIALLLSYTTPKIKRKIKVIGNTEFSERIRAVKEGDDGDEEKNTIKILCDFDGTITKKDVSIAVLDKFTNGEWRDTARSILKGNIGSREIYELSAEKIKGNLNQMIEFVKDFGEIEDGFREFVEYLKVSGKDMEILSDGFGFYIRGILEKYGMKFKYYSAELLEKEGKFYFEFPNKCDFCKLCATCKLKIARESKSSFRVFIGNGISDRCIVEEAEIIFAKSRLKEICAQKALNFFPFENFHEIINAFESEPECFITDFDGTIAWSYDGILDAFTYTFKKLGRKVPEKTKMGKIIGLPLVECFRIFLEDDELAKKAVEIFRKRYEEIFLEKTYLAPGVLGTLRKLKKLGYKIGVLSNKLGEKLRRLIKHLGISEFIDIAIGEGDILHHNKDVVLKPDPRTVYFIVEELRVSPEKTVIVGDTEVDMETAIRANMSFVALYSSSRTPKYFEETWRKQKENGNSEESKKQKTFLYLISSFDGLINLAHFFKVK